MFEHRVFEHTKSVGEFINRDFYRRRAEYDEKHIHGDGIARPAIDADDIIPAHLDRPAALRRSDTFRRDIDRAQTLAPAAPGIPNSPPQ